MKITKTYTTEVCDLCLGADYVEPCPGCGKVFCPDCSVRYPVDGISNRPEPDDGVYCLECDGKLQDDPLHKVYAELKEFLQRKMEVMNAMYQEEDEIEKRLMAERTKQGLAED